MGIRATKLRRHATNDPVVASLDDQLTLDSLFEAEEQWCVPRVHLLRDISRSGLRAEDWPQSLHWSWAYKAALLEPVRLGIRGDVRLFGVAAESQWQGLLCGVCEGYSARLDAAEPPLVYVDFLESAPWNWRVSGLPRQPIFRGVGVQLAELAVSWSLLLGYGGRIGLHALSQAEDFYRDRCGLTDLGRDPEYHDMRYFEFSEEQARQFLERQP